MKGKRGGKMAVGRLHKVYVVLALLCAKQL